MSLVTSPILRFTPSRSTIALPIPSILTIKFQNRIYFSFVKMSPNTNVSCLLLRYDTFSIVFDSSSKQYSLIEYNSFDFVCNSRHKNDGFKVCEELREKIDFSSPRGIRGAELASDGQKPRSVNRRHDNFKHSQRSLSRHELSRGTLNAARVFRPYLFARDPRVSSHGTRLSATSRCMLSK